MLVQLSLDTDDFTLVLVFLVSIFDPAIHTLFVVGLGGVVLSEVQDLCL